MKGIICQFVKHLMIMCINYYYHRAVRALGLAFCRKIKGKRGAEMRTHIIWACRLAFFLRRNSIHIWETSMRTCGAHNQNKRTLIHIHRLTHITTAHINTYAHTHNTHTRNFIHHSFNILNTLNGQTKPRAHTWSISSAPIPANVNNELIEPFGKPKRQSPPAHKYVAIK